MEPWEESLDVDDSDLQPPTVLRRCNHHRSTATTTTTQTLASSPSPSQTVISLPQTLTPAHPAQSPPQSRTIPGPAGIIQVAKLRKHRDSVNCVGQEEHPMATQEYIRMVVEDPEEDEDFKRNPWLSAVEFVYADGVFNLAYNLGEIDKRRRNGKLDQVVAVIKSCTPNGLGDMTVALKDPTGTVSGTVHHKVLTEGDFRKGICVGSVIILHKVSVFSPSRSTHYLNITKRNLVKDVNSVNRCHVFLHYVLSTRVVEKTLGKGIRLPWPNSHVGWPSEHVFYKDGGSSQKQTIHGTIDAAPYYEDSGQGTPALGSGSAFHLERGAEGITNRMKRSNTNNEQESMNCISINLKITIEDSGQETPALGSAFHLERGAEGITNRMKRRNTNNEQENMNCTSTTNRGTSLDIAIEDSGQGTPALGSAFLLEQGAEGITNRMKRSNTYNEQENMNCTSITNRGTNLDIATVKETLKEANIIENAGQLSEGYTNGFQTVKALLPDWTDEQLLQLSDWDDV